MEENNPTEYNTIPHGFKQSFEASVTRKLDCKTLRERLKALLDRVTDPAYQLNNPASWAKDYGLLIMLIFTQDIEKKHVKHNLGRKRWELIQKIIKGIKEQVEGSLDRK